MDIFTALAEPTRRNIVEMLAKKGQLAAADICANFNVSAPAISQHLKILREANVVQMEKRAQQRIYQINPDSMIMLGNWVEEITKLWHQRFDSLEEVLKMEKDKLAQQNKEERHGKNNSRSKSK